MRRHDNGAPRSAVGGPMLPGRCRVWPGGAPQAPGCRLGDVPALAPGLASSETPPRTAPVCRPPRRPFIWRELGRGAECTIAGRLPSLAVESAQYQRQERRYSHALQRAAVECRGRLRFAGTGRRVCCGPATPGWRGRSQGKAMVQPGQLKRQRALCTRLMRSGLAWRRDC